MDNDGSASGRPEVELHVAVLRMTSHTESPEVELKLRDFCDRIGANYRDARYALAHGMVPQGICEEPGRGKHRVFNYHQAFWLAILLKLKAAGIQPKLAAEMAKWAESVKGFAVNSGWDWRFSPFDGQYATHKQWFLELGDAQLVRIMTDANPSRQGVVDVTGWVDMQSRQGQPDSKPTVIVRIDLSQLANQLRDEAVS